MKAFESWKKGWRVLRAWYIAKMIKATISLLLRTCRITFRDITLFADVMQRHDAIIIFWHNRMAIAPALLAKYTKAFHFTALISASKDGEILTQIVRSYKNGQTIRVPHLNRYQVLQKIIQHVKEKESILVMTPDGPRGPRYKVKPGIAITAKETGAHVVVFNWTADRYWEFHSWDRLRLPKPFAKITASLTIHPPLEPHLTIEQAQEKIGAFLSE